MFLLQQKQIENLKVSALVYPMIPADFNRKSSSLAPEEDLKPRPNAV